MASVGAAWLAGMAVAHDDNPLGVAPGPNLVRVAWPKHGNNGDTTGGRHMPDTGLGRDHAPRRSDGPHDVPEVATDVIGRQSVRDGCLLGDTALGPDQGNRHIAISGLETIL